MTETTKQIIKPYADSLNNRLKEIPYVDYITTIVKLAEHCDVSEHIVYNCRCGRTYLRKSDRTMIESFFNEKIF